MNDLQFASVSLPGARASTGWWGEQTSPGEQGFGQSLVFMSRTNAEPQNLVIAPWLQQLSVKRTFGSRDRFALLPDVNVVVTCSYAQISNSATDFVRWARTNHACPVDTQEHQIWWRFVGSLAHWMLAGFSALHFGCCHEPVYSPSYVGAAACPLIPSNDRNALNG